MSHHKAAVAASASTAVAEDGSDMTAASGDSAAAGATWRSDVSSDVTSLSLMTQRTVTSDNDQVLHTARQLIAELQAMLPDDRVDDDGTTGAKEAGQAVMRRREMRSSPSSSSERSAQPGPIRQQEDPPAPGKLRHPHRQPEEAPLHLRACNGLCVVFVNFSSFLPDGTTDDAAAAAAASDHGGQRAGQLRDSAAAVGRLFNAGLEFTVLVHWNKSRCETLQLLRQAASAMCEDGRDCCFAIFLGRGGPGHFVAACGGRVSLTDILATLAVGQRARLPVFVLGELTAVEQQQQQQPSPDAPPASVRLNLPSNQLLLWTLGAPQVTDMLADQLARSHLSGGKDVASTVAGIAEWIRRRGRVGGCGCRFLSKLDRLVYLTLPDCI